MRSLKDWGLQAERAQQIQAFLIFQAVFWGANLAIRTIAAVQHRPELAVTYFPDRALIVLCSLFATTLVGFVLMYFERWPQLARLGLALALCFLLLPPMGSLEIALPRRLGVDMRDVSFSDYVFQFGWIYFMWAGYYFAQDQLFRTRRHAEDLQRAQAFAHASQLKMLRYQLNPHFLFNSLNAISTLVLEGRNKEAETMILRLSRFLRHTVDSDPTPLARLGDEARIQRLYLEIEAVRFGENLRVDCNVPESLHECLVPSLLLQPIVENAIKHGVSLLPNGGWVRIRAAREGDDLMLSVENDGPPLKEGAKDSRGIGLRNTAERLEALYGDEGRVRMEARPAGGARVEIALPYRVTPRERSLAPV